MKPDKTFMPREPFSCEVAILFPNDVPLHRYRILVYRARLVKTSITTNNRVAL